MVDRSFAVPFVHRVRFARGVFDVSSRVLDDVLLGDEAGGSGGERMPRALMVVDSGLCEADSAFLGRVRRYIETRRGTLAIEAEPLVVPGGERCKNDPNVLDAILRAMQRAKICRRSYLVVVGGGAVLDVAGYAASIFHRGVRLVRLPSTTLAQDDSGVGVKSGVNWLGVKNLVGAFWPPWAVINDEDLLRTLSDEHWRSGFSEAVKVALLKDATLFDRIEASAARLRARDMGAATPIIRESALLHLAHIVDGGDAFEFRHARPLDFGHWAAHRLESMTGFALTHGHAVSIGLALDCTYAALMGQCERGLAERVIACLRAIGLPISHESLGRVDELMEGLEQFREHLGGRLTITLVRKPGEGFEVHEVDERVMREAVRKVTRGTA